MIGRFGDTEDQFLREATDFSRELLSRKHSDH